MKMSKKKWNWSINNIEIEGYDKDTGKIYVSITNTQSMEYGFNSLTTTYFQTFIYSNQLLYSNSYGILNQKATYSHIHWILCHVKHTCNGEIKQPFSF